MGFCGDADALLAALGTAIEAQLCDAGALEPVLPGVILSEHVFQTGALLAARLLGPGDGRESAEEGIPVLTRIEGARFRRIVRPGEELATRVRLEERAGPAFRMSGEVRCGAARVLRIGFVVSSTGGLSSLGV